MTNPYRRQKDFAFWSRSMTSLHHHEIDTVTEYHAIAPDDKIVTMGSCFAQHLARYIIQSGANYFISERPPEGMAAEEARAKQYGVYSARYGNVYTVRQATQLFDRAFGTFQPAESIWKRDERFVDAFRPQLEPAGFSSLEDVRTEREAHFSHVRAIFEQADWLVFTLGLTEAWRSRQDGAIFPVAPGVAGGVFDPTAHEFVNFSAAEVIEHLSEYVARVRSVNNRVKILLTISPVPLIATYENRHVWVSTTYSKAVLRVAAEEAVKRHREVIYFPSYEIITSPAAGGRYYNDDLREVNDLGVAHVMRVFGKHFFGKDPEVSSEKNAVSRAITHQSPVVCDEELIERSLANSGR